MNIPLLGKVAWTIKSGRKRSEGLLALQLEEKAESGSFVVLRMCVALAALVTFQTGGQYGVSLRAP